MDSLTTAILAKSLDGLSARAQATAQNIANASSPSYRPMRVRFEDALRSAGANETAVREIRPTLEADPTFVLGDSVRVDLEIATAASTAGRYAALVELLNRQAQITALAVSGGR